MDEKKAAILAQFLEMPVVWSVFVEFVRGRVEGNAELEAGAIVSEVERIAGV